MRKLGTLIKDFVNELEFANYINPLNTNTNVSLTIRRVFIPPYMTLAIRVEFDYHKEGFHIVDTYVIFTDDLTRKVFWKEYANSNIIGPFDTYEIAAMSLECYLMSLYNEIIWRDSSEIKLDFTVY